MSCITENKDVSSAKSFALDAGVLSDQEFKSKTINGQVWNLDVLQH